MKTGSRQWAWKVIACALMIASWDAFALSLEYPNNRPVTCIEWPDGMDKLVNATNRIRGVRVNAEEIFFFSGTAAEFTAFLLDYSQIAGIESRRLILHDGVGEAKFPWEKTGRPCDWKLYGCPKGWHDAAKLSKQRTNSVEAIQKAAKQPGYILEVHFWTGGHIALEQVSVPKNVDVKKEK